MSNDSIGWIKQRKACLDLIQKQGPGVWKAVQEAIEADLDEFSALFPRGPIEVASRSQAENRLTVEFRANDETGATVGRATLIVSFRFLHAGNGVGVISSSWPPHRSEQFKRAVASDFEISRCDNGVALLTTRGGTIITAQAASMAILQDALFSDGLPSSPRQDPG